MAENEHHSYDDSATLPVLQKPQPPPKAPASAKTLQSRPSRSSPRTLRQRGNKDSSPPSSRMMYIILLHSWYIGLSNADVPFSRRSNSPSSSKSFASPGAKPVHSCLGNVCLRLPAAPTLLPNPPSLSHWLSLVNGPQAHCRTLAWGCLRYRHRSSHLSPLPLPLHTPFPALAVP